MSLTMDTKKIQSALDCISSDCPREEWVRVLMAIKSTLGDSGLALAEAWSEKSHQFKHTDFLSTWRSISEQGRIRVGTLFHLAKANGWSEGAPFRFSLIQTNTSIPKTPSKTFAYASDLWRSSSNADVANHPYAESKGIYWPAGAARGIASGSLIGQSSDCVIVPMRGLTGEFKGVECIAENGSKQTFGNKGVLILGNDLNDELTQIIVEGWATAARTFHIFKGDIAIYACFGKGKMQQLSHQLEVQYPQRRVVIMVEQDG